MENMKDNPISSAAPKLASDEELKAKYGKVYRIGMTVSEDDENEVELVYRFKRPSVASYDRYVKTLARSAHPRPANGSCWTPWWKRMKPGSPPTPRPIPAWPLRSAASSRTSWA